MPQTCYTQREYDTLDNEVRNYSSALFRLIDALGRIDRTETELRDSNNEWNLIPLNIRQFYKLMLQAKTYYENNIDMHKQPKFVDAGCGIGDKMLIASFLGMNAYGIEINKEYHKIVRNMFGESKVILGDIRTQSYKDYDIIYYYSPIKHVHGRKFERKVEDDMKIGAILIPCNKHSHNEIRKDLRFKAINYTSSIYVKIKGGKRRFSKAKRKAE